MKCCAAEASLGVKLPDEYIALLRIQNGGYTLGFGYSMPSSANPADDYAPLDDLAGIITDPELKTAQNLLDSAYMIKEWGLPERQVLLSGDGHWWISLDYRKGDTPSVTWIESESGSCTHMAPTFAAFLEGLQPRAAFERQDDE